jgi:D,D-heptose 1,7-bisphosphate phosphatase
LWKRICTDRQPAIFVDRDDTLMVDVNYCDDPRLVQLIPGAAEGIRELRRAGYMVIIVTNQSGIGRGYFSVETLGKIHESLRDKLRERDADYDAVYYCPHLPDDGCDCRKPKPGLLLRAASDLNIDLSASYAIGDRDLDVEAGRAAGTRTVLVLNSDREQGENCKAADFIVSSLEEAAKLILTGTRGRGETGV